MGRTRAGHHTAELGRMFPDYGEGGALANGMPVIGAKVRCPRRLSDKVARSTYPRWFRATAGPRRIVAPMER